MRLEKINDVIPVSKDVINCLWHSLAEVMAEIFVEG